MIGLVKIKKNIVSKITFVNCFPRVFSTSERSSTNADTARQTWSLFVTSVTAILKCDEGRSFTLILKDFNIYISPTNQCFKLRYVVPFLKQKNCVFFLMCASKKDPTTSFFCMVYTLFYTQSCNDSRIQQYIIYTSILVYKTSIRIIIKYMIPMMNCCRLSRPEHVHEASIIQQQCTLVYYSSNNQRVWLCRYIWRVPYPPQRASCKKIKKAVVGVRRQSSTVDHSY